MKGFVEITDAKSGRKSLTPIKRIIAVDEQADGTAYVAVDYARLGIKKDRVVGVGTFTTESYEEIKNRLEAASK